MYGASDNGNTLHVHVYLNGIIYTCHVCFDFEFWMFTIANLQIIAKYYQHFLNVYFDWKPLSARRLFVCARVTIVPLVYGGLEGHGVAGTVL